MNSVVYSFVAASQTDPSCVSSPSHPRHLVLDRLGAAVDRTIGVGVAVAPGNATPPDQLHHRPFGVAAVAVVVGAVDVQAIVEVVLGGVLAGFY